MNPSLVTLFFLLAAAAAEDAAMAAASAPLGMLLPTVVLDASCACVPEARIGLARVCRLTCRLEAALDCSATGNAGVAWADIFPGHLRGRKLRKGALHQVCPHSSVIRAKN